MIGVVAFSVSGAVAARRARMDWFGVVVLGVIVAVGGGTLRDLLIGRTPVGWIEQGWPVPLAAATAVATLIPFVYRILVHGPARHTVLAADAVGLASFSVTGADVALRAGMSWWVAVTLGVMTAVFGGIFRDVLINERPAVLTGEVYALAAAIGATLFVTLDAGGVHRWAAVWVPVLVALTLRVLVLWRGWTTPTLGDTG